jgi:hypothetical protein
VCAHALVEGAGSVSPGRLWGKACLNLSGRDENAQDGNALLSARRRRRDAASRPPSPYPARSRAITATLSIAPYCLWRRTSLTRAAHNCSRRFSPVCSPRAVGGGQGQLAGSCRDRRVHEVIRQNVWADEDGRLAWRGERMHKGVQRVIDLVTKVVMDRSVLPLDLGDNLTNGGSTGASSAPPCP